jgi:hypothetical protein
LHCLFTFILLNACNSLNSLLSIPSL